MNEINGGGGDDTFVATNFSASQVSVTINAQGNVVFSDGQGDVDTLERFTTIQLSDATITINGNTLTQQNVDGTSLVSTFNVSGEAYTGSIAYYSAAGALARADFGGLAYAAGDYVTFIGNASGVGGTVSVDTAAGTTLASLAVNSDFVPSQFTLSDDGVGGLKLNASLAADVFNGDGRSDLLLENTSGAVVVGEVVNGSESYAQVAALGPEWSFKGNGDFLGGANQDFLIENSSGAVAVGAVSGGTTSYTQIGALGPEWSFEGVGDFLNNGQDQFLIENTSGALDLGNVIGRQALYTQIGSLGPEWSFEGTGDFLGDGKTSFLIENTSGAVDIGAVVNGQAQYTQVATLGPEWEFCRRRRLSGNGNGRLHDRERKRRRRFGNDRQRPSELFASWGARRRVDKPFMRPNGTAKGGAPEHNGSRPPSSAPKLLSFISVDATAFIR